MSLFDLQRAELTVSLQDDVDFLRVPIPVEIEIRLQPRVLIAFHDFRYSKVFQQRTAHGPAFGHLRGGPAGEVANQASVVEVQFRRFDGALENVVGVGMQ